MKSQCLGEVWDIRKLQVFQCRWSLGAHWKVIKDVADKVGRSQIIIRVLRGWFKEFGLYLRESGHNPASGV